MYIFETFLHCKCFYGRRLSKTFASWKYFLAVSPHCLVKVAAKACYVMRLKSITNGNFPLFSHLSWAQERATFFLVLVISLLAVWWPIFHKCFSSPPTTSGTVCRYALAIALLSRIEEEPYPALVTIVPLCTCQLVLSAFLSRKAKKLFSFTCFDRDRIAGGLGRDIEFVI